MALAHQQPGCFQGFVVGGGGVTEERAAKALREERGTLCCCLWWGSEGSLRVQGSGFVLVQ